jgi:hypothetical protein
MTRILYWNLQNFSLRKLQNNRSWETIQEANRRKKHVVREVIAPKQAAGHPPPAKPDLIVITEVFDRVQEISHQGVALPAASRPGMGVLLLLEEIKRRLGRTWCVVPPLCVGDEGFREGVAVFYDAAKLQFTGPYVWTNNDGFGRGRAPTAQTLPALTDYTVSWENGLPHPNNPDARYNRTWIVAGQNVPEWRSAARWEHYNNAPQRINFPYPRNRSPYYTRMKDLTNNRTLKLFAVHTSPRSADAATKAVAAIPDLVPGANEVSVVVGDFNVDSFKPGAVAAGGSYHPLLNLQFTMLLDPRQGGAVNPARRPYCLTHLLPPSLATPFNANGVPPDPQHNVYPRFGYMGSTAIRPLRATDSGSIDNIFLRYAAGLAPPANFNTTIVNTVVGKPYQAPPAPGIGPGLTEGHHYASSMMPPGIPAAGVNPAPGIGTFMAPGNFKKIITSSDHLAILFDV